MMKYTHIFLLLKEGENERKFSGGGTFLRLRAEGRTMMERGICGRISTTSTLCGGLCVHGISWEYDEVEDMLLCEERSPSSSDMEPSRIGGPKNSPDGTVEVKEEVHGIAGGDEDSSGS